jgi:hypothetical protein
VALAVTVVALENGHADVRGLVSPRDTFNLNQPYRSGNTAGVRSIWTKHQLAPTRAVYVHSPSGGRAATMIVVHRHDPHAAATLARWRRWMTRELEKAAR